VHLSNGRILVTAGPRIVEIAGPERVWAQRPPHRDAGRPHVQKSGEAEWVTSGLPNEYNKDRLCRAKALSPKESC
jgi:hypothetical protein